MARKKRTALGRARKVATESDETLKAASADKVVNWGVAWKKYFEPVLKGMVSLPSEGVAAVMGGTLAVLALFGLSVANIVAVKLPETVVIGMTALFGISCAQLLHRRLSKPKTLLITNAPQEPLQADNAVVKQQELFQIGDAVMKKKEDALVSR